MASFFSWLPWLAVGDFANVAQLSGVNAVQLITMVVKAANNARMHKANCRQFAQHLKLISNLLQKLNLTDLKKRPESREPLELLEQALRKAVLLVESCRDKSYLYLVAMGWVYVTKFRDFQDEIDRYLKLIPLISLVENTRVSSFSLLPYLFQLPSFESELTCLQQVDDDRISLNLRLGMNLQRRLWMDLQKYHSIF